MRLFSSESVTEGHPDKIADQVADAILDAIIAKDPFGRVAAEVFVTNGLVLIGGEVSTECYVDIPVLVREVIRDIGYTDPHYGFDYEACAVLTSIHQQSPDIAIGVDRAGAGDQGMMFGYATNETPELMPMPILLAHKLTKRLAEVRKKKILPFLRPDGKAQVTVRYDGAKPIAVESVVMSAHHNPDVSQSDLREALIEEVVKKIIPEELRSNNIQYYINPTGRFVIGGPAADTGITGRKNEVDCYGSSYYHGGGSFSGKDPTKVDRSASYFARYVAKNIVAAGMADRCGLQVAYAIGVAEPISLWVETFGSNHLPEEKITSIVKEVFDFTPGGMINALELLRPIYRKTSVYGHFGRNEKEFTWEKTNKIKELRKYM